MQELLSETSRLPEGNNALVGVIEKIDQLIQEELGPLSRRLYPAILRRGLVPALQSLGDQFESALSVTMELNEGFVADERTDRKLVPDQTRLAAYRIAEEALTNVVKHANASGVTVKVDLIDHGRLRLMVRDNGQGFDAKSVASGLGTVSMQDYSEAVGGGCTITSAPGRGTEVVATLPLLEQGAQNPERAGSLV